MKKFGCCLLLFLSQGCWVYRDEQGRTQAISPELAPVAVGIAVYNDVTETVLTVEFIQSSRCQRITPLDTFRFVLLQKGSDGAPDTALIDQFVSTRTKVLRHPKLGRGRYEIEVFHQDHTDQRVKKSFSISEKSPTVTVDVPCLDGEK